MTDDTTSDIYVLLDDVQGARSELFVAPQKVITANTPSELSEAFNVVETCVAQGFWAVGFFAYELGYLFEDRLLSNLVLPDHVPLMWFGIFEEPEVMSRKRVSDWLTETAGTCTTISPPHPKLNREEYRCRFDIVKSMIEAGDIYQLNLTFKSEFQISGDPAGLYRTLRDAQPTRHSSLIKTPDFSILSLSPELFLTRKGTMLETRPMKGTEPRGSSPHQDRKARDRLVSDEKQRAENLMIVDLMRNDIGRLAEIGSVKVPELFSVETYPSLHQMISRVQGNLPVGTTCEEIIRATFPAGSITGAPKVRAMELIGEIEDSPRGIYCGSIGSIDPEQNINLSVAIRTAIIIKDGTGEIGIGSGIVSDSRADSEYDEALLKMRFLTDVMEDFQLFETILYDGRKGYWLFDEHMHRLSASAVHFDFTFDQHAIVNALSEETCGREEERVRVRLDLERNGKMTVKSAVLPTPASGPPVSIAFVVSPTKVDSQDVFLGYKTTRRDLYDEEFAHYGKAFGSGEVIYVNERGELTEGSRTNIFLEFDGVLLTPSLTSGVLPGTLRRHLLETGRALEADLAISSLIKADAIYLGNSVMGLQPSTHLLI